MKLLDYGKFSWRPGLGFPDRRAVTERADGLKGFLRVFRRWENEICVQRDGF